MSNIRKSHSSKEKARLVTEVLRGECSISEIAAENNINPNLLIRWKKEAMEGLSSLFENKRAKARKQQQDYDAEVDELHRQIGKLTAQLEWAKKKSGI